MFHKLKTFYWPKNSKLKNDRLLFTGMAVGAVLGIVASLVLSVEAITLAKNPDAVLACSVNIVLNCATVAKHASSELLGFPNSFVGMLTLPVVLTIAVAGLAGVSFPRWFMRAAQIGALAGVVFAGWMFYESYVVIGALCPWCLLTDFSMLVIFFMIFRYNALHGSLCIRSKTIEKFVAQGYDLMALVAVVVLLAALIIVKYGDGLFT